MSTALADTPAANSRHAATGQPPPAGHMPRADPATSPAPAAAGHATPALPRRIRDARNAARPGRKAPLPAGPETLRRVLDGLNRL